MAQKISKIFEFKLDFFQKCLIGLGFAKGLIVSALIIILQLSLGIGTVLAVAFILSLILLVGLLEKDKGFKGVANVALGEFLGIIAINAPASMFIDISGILAVSIFALIMALTAVITFAYIINSANPAETNLKG